MELFQSIRFSTARRDFTAQGPEVAGKAMNRETFKPAIKMRILFGGLESSSVDENAAENRGIKTLRSQMFRRVPLCKPKSHGYQKDRRKAPETLHIGS